MTNSLALAVALFSLVAFPAPAQRFRGRLVLGEEVARQRVAQARLPKLAGASAAAPDTATALAVAEKVAFREFGRKNIIAQRPYEAYLVDGYWCISGTLPWGYEGGTFVVLLNAATYQVAKVSHGQ
ncbi:NTF2 fold immunity protein [Hymenobacter chitinivorans]|nr:NTF2 fold immunity protein [Hymenobacter chitinivorans]